MPNDVEALFKKINQADLPYQVFNNSGDVDESELQSPQGAEKVYAKPNLVEAVAKAEAAPRQPARAAQVAPKPSAGPSRPGGFLSRYAPPPAAEPAGEQRLDEIFARMRAPR